MSHYDKNPKDLTQDAKEFVNSEYGKYLVGILQEKAKGHLSNVADINVKYPRSYAAKYSALKEVLELIYSPLDDGIPSLG